MDSFVALAALAFVPVLLALFLRVSAVFIFLSLVAGNLLVTYVGDDAGLSLGMFVKGANADFLANLGLLLLPVVLSLLFLRRTLPKSKFLLHLPALIASGLSLAVLALPLFDSNAQEQIFANQYGMMIRENQDIIIGATALMVLFIMWMTYRHKGDKKHKKH